MAKKKQQIKTDVDLKEVIEPIAPTVELEVEPEAEIEVAEVFEEKITKESLQNAILTLQKYKEGKASLEAKITANELWFKMRSWENMRHVNDNQSKPVSAWLHNSISNKHADMMDNYPEPTVLPREESDKDTAKSLTDILPVVLECNDYEAVYDECAWYKLKQGTAVKKIIWNQTKENGLGDIEVKKVDILNIFVEPGVADIQDSQNVFHVELADKEVLEEQNGLDKGTLSESTVDVTKYAYDDYIDTTNKACVIDWYYKKTVGTKTVLHYVKFVNDIILFATENDPEYAGVGWYNHGMYPFVVDTLFPNEGSIFGFGYIDIMKDCQEYIDKLNQAILSNTQMAAMPRYFYRDDASINIDELCDWTKPFVHVDGNLGQDAIRQIEVPAVQSNVINVLQMKIDELKETSGNRDFSQGSTSAGVTAASAIAALQEAGSKLSRDLIKSSYRAFKSECEMIIELIRQFYDNQRTFRILGEQGEEEFTQFDNMAMKPQPQGNDFAVEMGERLPVFDVKVSIAKKSTYSRMAQNELAIQFYNLGFFAPQNSDQTLACLDMLDFEGKDKMIRRISNNGTMFQMIQQLQMQLAQLQQEVGMAPNQQQMQGAVASGQESQDINYDSLGGPRENDTITEQAKEQAQKSSEVR